MKILLVSERFLPRPLGGGVSRHLHDLAKYLYEQGDEVHVLTSRFSYPAFESSLPEGVEVIKRLNPKKDGFLERACMLYNSLNLVNQLNRIGNKYDIVHAHAGTRLDFLYRHKLGTPVIVSLHGVRPHCFYDKTQNDICNLARGARCASCFIKRYPTLSFGSPAVAIECYCHYKLLKRTLTKIPSIICVSEDVKQEAMDYYGLPISKMITIPNGVRLENFHNVQRTQLRQFRKDLAHGHDKIILFVGSLLPVKGVDVLISSMLEILKTVNAKLVIVGFGPARRSFEELVQRQNLSSHVFFVGGVDDETLNLMYQVADVAVVPSLAEPFGITAIQAFAAQTPLVVSDTGGLSEIVENGRTGIKVAPNNARSLAEGIIKILSNRSFAESLSANAFREVLEKYTWEKVGSRIRNLYQDIIKKGTRY